MTVNRERKMVRAYAESADMGDGTTLNELYDRVKYLLATYGPTATIEDYQEPYANYSYMAVMVERLETDIEYAARIKLEERYGREQEERDMRTYERMKQKLCGK